MKQNNILVENKFGHGAIVSNKYWRFVKRLFRRRTHIVGMASPVNWLKPRTPLNLIIKNQYSSYSCGGQMTAYMIELLTNTVCSAKSFYSQGFYSGGGMADSTIKKQIDSSGINTEASVASYKSDGTTDEGFMISTSWKTNDLLNDGITRSGYKAIPVNVDIESIASAIETYGAVGWLIQGQNNGTWLTSNPLPPKSKIGLWGHWMAVGDYYTNNLGNKEIVAVQSWGTSVGESGYQFFGEEYINSGYIIEAFAFQKSQVFTLSMGYGSVGSQVYLLQNRLIKEGVATFQTATGFFGQKTLDSVKAYQTKYGIPSTGYVASLTLAQLNKSIV